MAATTTIGQSLVLAHTALYGGYLLAWAEPSGSMPEPWHWECVS